MNLFIRNSDLAWSQVVSIDHHRHERTGKPSASTIAGRNCSVFVIRCGAALLLAEQLALYISPMSHFDLTENYLVALKCANVPLSLRSPDWSWLAVHVDTTDIPLTYSSIVAWISIGHLAFLDARALNRRVVR